MQYYTFELHRQRVKRCHNYYCAPNGTHMFSWFCTRKNGQHSRVITNNHVATPDSSDTGATIMKSTIYEVSPTPQWESTLPHNLFDIKYYPGKDNLADYRSMHHTGAHQKTDWHGISMNQHQSENYLEQVSPALWKGVLELSQMGTYWQTHYHKFPLIRVSQIVRNTYHLTLESH